MAGAAGPCVAGPCVADVRAAERRLHGRLHRTPLLTCGSLDSLAGRRLLFKCELFQRTGSFKVRGDGGAGRPRGGGCRAAAPPPRGLRSPSRSGEP